MNFLVSAYGCEPNKGSEPGIGWQWSLQLARFGEVWIITRSNNRENIEIGVAQLDKERAKKLHFIYYDTDDFIRKIKKGAHNLYPYYFCWQIGAYHKAKELCKTIKFDYCFGLTFGSIWMPTFMYKLTVPFVWGPIGGGEAVPREYYSLFGKKAAVVQSFRKVMKKTAVINPLVFLPANKAKTIITRTEDTANILSGSNRKKVHICLETAIDCSEVSEKKVFSDGELVEFIYSGRLIKLKAIELIIKAMGLSKNKERIHFTIVGEGPERKHLEELARKEGIGEQVVFSGKKDRQELLKMLIESDVYVFPSLKEGGSWSLMEAMASGLPVICLDAAGMHITTDTDCAIRVKVSSIYQTIQAYAEAIDKLIEQPTLREKMGRHARERIIEEYNWNSKGDFIEKVLQL